MLGFFPVFGEEAESVYKFSNGEEIRLIYNPLARGEEKVQTLSFSLRGSERFLEEVEAKDQIYADGTYGLQPYESCSIIAAQKKASKIVVMLEYKLGKQQVFRSDQTNRGYVESYWTNSDILLVQFSLNDSKWSKNISLYTQTMWGDIIGEPISGVSISGDQKISITFKSNWKIEKGKGLEQNKRRKIAVPEGSEIKNLLFDEDSNLVFTDDGKGQKFTSLTAVWWFGDNKSHIKHLREHSDKRMRTEAQARIKGEKLPTEKSVLTERLKSESIAIKAPLFVPREEKDDTTKLLRNK